MRRSTIETLERRLAGEGGFMRVRAVSMILVLGISATDGATAT
jgi:hypothetical protein